jgi:WD40 repeat protein
MEVPRERDELMGMAFAESGSTVVTAHANGTLRVWTFGQKQPSRELPNIFTQSSDYWTDLVGWCQVFHTAAVAVDGSGRLAAVGDNTQIKVVDLSTGAVLAKHYLDYRIACISCSLDGKAIIAGDQDGGVHIISLATS